MTVTPRLRLVTDAVGEPITLAEAQEYCRVDASEDDALLTALIGSARRLVEKETGLALMSQSWAAVFDRWPNSEGQGLSGPWWDGTRQMPISAVSSANVIDIPKRPFQAVTSIKLRDAFGSLTTVDPSIYFTEVSDMRGKIMRVLGQVWPIVILAPRSAIEIAFTAGFDAAPYAGVPDDLKTAIKMLVKHWYDNREMVTEGNIGKTPMHVTEILRYYRPGRLS